MPTFRYITPTFAVAGQLSLDDIARAGAEGFKTLIKNRPENEEPGQLSEAAIVAAAKSVGMTYRALPFTGQPPPAVVAETVLAFEQNAGPILAFCRSGMRSSAAWAMAQALSGRSSPDEVIALAAGAGFDLGGIREALECLAPPR
jgi:uncharacterized protein (TIGR01244 family)